MSDQRRPRIVVVGSFMMDLVVKVPRRPVKGETLVGSDFGMFPGGKGFNQAVGAARLGAQVTMVGRLGQDIFGDAFIAAGQP
jgi:ribokinase